MPQFEIVRDLLGGNKPETIDIFYNGDLAVSSVTLRYAGSFVKRMDIDDVDHGWFLTWAGVATIMENVVGILAEDQGITDNYLPDHATLGMKIRKMYPVFPSSIIRGEYARTDSAGTANTDNGATAAAGGTTFSAATTGTADYINGGWIYMVTGAAAGELHYVLNDDGAGTVTVATAFINAVAAADTFLFISPANSDQFCINATYTGFLSEIDTDACQHYFLGLMNYIKSPGVALQPLQRGLHDGQVITNARFYHDVVFTGATDAASGLVSNTFIRGIAAA